MPEVEMLPCHEACLGERQRRHCDFGGTEPVCQRSQPVCPHELTPCLDCLCQRHEESLGDLLEQRTRDRPEA